MTSFRIPLAVPVLGPDTGERLLACVETNYVSSVGPFVPEFEKAFAAYVGAGYACAASSGTAAIHLALSALGVTAGSDVMVPTLTFIASANPARYCGAGVTLVDSEKETWNLDPELVVDELRRRAVAGERPPAAIVAVSLLGHPANLETLTEVAHDFGIPVVEDAAEALGARWTKGDLSGLAVGRAGVVGCYSFNGNKVITTGGGGMLVSDDEPLVERARHLSTQARLPGGEYRHDAVGFNYRLTNLAASLGLSQLALLDSFLERKRAIAARYDAAFAVLGPIDRAPNAEWAERSAWLYTALFEDAETRERIRLHLNDLGIDARPIWVPLHLQDPYANSRLLGDGNVAEDLAARALSLPSSVGMTEDEQDQVIDAVIRAVGR